MCKYFCEHVRATINATSTIPIGEKKSVCTAISIFCFRSEGGPLAFQCVALSHCLPCLPSHLLQFNNDTKNKRSNCFLTSAIAPKHHVRLQKMTALSLIIACVTLALCLSSVTAFRMPVSSRYVGSVSSRSQLSMEFDWKSFKKGNEERMGKSVESQSMDEVPNISLAN